MLSVLVISNKIKSNKHFVVHLNPFPANGFPHFKAYNEFAVLIILLAIKKKKSQIIGCLETFYHLLYMMMMMMRRRRIIIQ